MRIVAVVLSLLVVAGFMLFALDDISRASNHSRERIAGFEAPAPTPAAEQTREKRNARGRELIDDANDVLLRPFAGVAAGASSRWVQRGVPALLGLLAYGFLLGYLARPAAVHCGSGESHTLPDTQRSPHG